MRLDWQSLFLFPHDICCGVVKRTGRREWSRQLARSCRAAPALASLTRRSTESNDCAADCHGEQDKTKADQHTAAMRNHEECCVGMGSHQIRAEQSASQKIRQGCCQEQEQKKMRSTLPSWPSCKMNTPAASIHNTRRTRTRSNGYSFLCALWKGGGVAAQMAVDDAGSWCRQNARASS